MAAKTIRISLALGFLMTAIIFALHSLVLRYFSYRDKPVMPNFFTYLLLPGYRIGELVPTHHLLQMIIAVAFDSLLFGLPIWFILVISGRVKA